MTDGMTSLYIIQNHIITLLSHKSLMLGALRNKPYLITLEPTNNKPPIYFLVCWDGQWEYLQNGRSEVPDCLLQLQV